MGNQGYRVLGLDLDGVCADYVGGFRAFCMQRMDLPAEAFPEPSAYNLSKAGWPFASTAEYLEMHQSAVRNGLLARLPAYEGAAESLQQLSDAHVHIRVVSHRLIFGGSHERIVVDTARWLEEQEIPYMSLCFTGLKDTVGATVHIEDSPDALDALGESELGTVVTFDQPYNRDQPGSRMMSWRHGLPLLRTLLDEDVTG